MTMSAAGETARIIPFPARRNAAAPDEGQERLRRALEGLDDAIAGQRVAVAAWRKALGELGTVMSGLGESLHSYRGNLDKLGERVAGLNSQARKLEQIADAALASRPE
jgi:chromosome segregation ATPase